MDKKYLQHDFKKWSHFPSQSITEEYLGLKMVYNNQSEHYKLKNLSVLFVRVQHKIGYSIAFCLGSLIGQP